MQVTAGQTNLEVIVPAVRLRTIMHELQVLHVLP